MGHIAKPLAQVPTADGQQGPTIQGATQGLNLPGDGERGEWGSEAGMLAGVPTTVTGTRGGH